MFTLCTVIRRLLVRVGKSAPPPHLQIKNCATTSFDKLKKYATTSFVNLKRAPSHVKNKLCTTTSFAAFKKRPIISLNKIKKCATTSFGFTVMRCLLIREGKSAPHPHFQNLKTAPPLHLSIEKVCHHLIWFYCIKVPFGQGG